jgi:hypothetical protein
MTSRIQFAEVAVNGTLPKSSRVLRHPFFAWAGLRPTLAQHTRAEHDALMCCARNARIVVEIGVAEGASAAGLREAMAKEGTLFLIDPFHLSRVPALNFLKRAAKRVVRSAGSARTVWLESFSHDAVRGWNMPIDFLLIDGDHRKEAVERDWNDWSPFVTEEGLVAFHDARQFAGGWTTPDYGPVCFINRMFRQTAGSSWSIVKEVDSLVFVSRRKS